MAKLPIHFRYFRAAVAYFLIGGFLGFLFNFPQVWEFTHGTPIVSAHIILVFFGWVTLTIMGAMGKMAPTMLGRELYSEDLAEIVFRLLNIGIVGYSSLLFLEWLLINASNFAFPPYWRYLKFLFVDFIIVSCFAFACNLYKSIRAKESTVPDPSIELTLNFYKASTAFLLLSLVIAFLVLAGFTRGLIASPKLANVLWIAPFTTLGWMAMTIMGAMYHLVPMFTLSKIPNLKLVKFQFWAMNFGILLTGIASLLGVKRVLKDFSPLGLAQTTGVIFLGIGVFLFLYNIYEIVERRKRKEFNISMKFYTVALSCFSATTIFGILLKFKVIYDFAGGTKIVLGHALLSVIGFVSLTIMGSMYSIIPLLTVVELHVRSKEVPKVVTEMYNEKLARASFWLSTIGIFGYITGLVLEGYVGTTLSRAGVAPAIIEKAVFPYQMLSIVFVSFLYVAMLLFAYNIREIMDWLKD